MADNRLKECTGCHEFFAVTRGGFTNHQRYCKPLIRGAKAPTSMAFTFPNVKTDNPAPSRFPAMLERLNEIERKVNAIYAAICG